MKLLLLLISANKTTLVKNQLKSQLKKAEIKQVIKQRGK